MAFGALDPNKVRFMIPGVALCEGGNVVITKSAWEDREFRKIVSVVLVSIDDGGSQRVSSAAGEWVMCLSCSVLTWSDLSVTTRRRLSTGNQ
jgi:hypothetical protein